MLVAAALSGVCLVETWEASDEEDGEEEESLTDLLPAFRDARLAGLLLWFLIIEVAGSWVESVLPLYAHKAVK